MKHTPYGYKIINGKAVIEEIAANKVVSLFTAYVEGNSLVSSSKKSDLNITHSQISKILCKKEYLGDDFYPPIIGKDLFEKVQMEKQRRIKNLGRLNKAKETKVVTPLKKFIFSTSDNVPKEPFEKAEYLYSFIESRDENNDE